MNIVLKTKNSFTKYFIFSLSVFFVFFHTSCASAQDFSISNKKAIRLFEEGYDFALKYNDQKAVEKLKEAIEIEPKFVEALSLLGEIYNDKKEFDQALVYYQLAINVNEKKYAQYYSLLADVYMKQMKFDLAVESIQQYLDKANPKQAMAEKYKIYLRKCTVAAQLMSNPVPFTPINLGENVNSSAAEYHPTLPADGSFMFYTVRAKQQGNACVMSDGTTEDFYVVQRENSNWSLRKNVGPPINSECNEGAGNISPDGRFMFFAASNNLGRNSSMDLYIVERKGSVWSAPASLGPVVNTDGFESQPSFSSDGKTLYFISNRPGGVGGNDVWITSRNTKGEWSMPVNAGDIINTRGNEISPFIHPDNQTLYFCSDGHDGMGGYDFFISRKDAQGQFQMPENLGYPINTTADERSLVISADGTKGYFASNNFSGFGDYDLYMFEIPLSARPQHVTYLKGMVYDKKTNQPLKAQFQLIDVSNSTVVVESYSDLQNGQFLVSIPPGKKYALNVSKQGYLFYSESYDVATHDSLQPFLIDIPLQPIEVGGSVVLKNVYFETDKFLLLNDSKSELLVLVDLMKNNPTMKIEIGGHTDNQGNKSYNQKLSENRSKAVYDYIITQGIPSTRLTYKGYGDASPIASNDNVEGRARNRRTEFKVISR